MTPTNHNRGKESSPQIGRPSVYQTNRLAELVLSGMRWLRELCVRGRLFLEIRRRLKSGKKSDINYPTDALKVAPTFIVKAERIEGFAIAAIVVNSTYLEWEKKWTLVRAWGVCTFKAHSVLDLGHSRNVPDVVWGCAFLHCLRISAFFCVYCICALNFLYG